MLDFGDFAADLGNAVGVLTGEAFKLAAEGDRIIDAMVDGVLGLAADLREAGRDTVRADQKGHAAQRQAADESPSQE